MSTTGSVLAYNILALLGTLILVLVIVTACLSSSVKQRRASWYAFLLSGLFFEVVALLSWGRQSDGGKPPGETICQAQAIFTYPALMMMPFSGLFMVLQVVAAPPMADNIHKYLRCLVPTNVKLLFLIPTLPPVGTLLACCVMAIVNPANFVQDSARLRCHISSSATALFHWAIFASILAMIFVIPLIVNILHLIRKQSTVMTHDINTHRTMFMRLFIFNIGFCVFVLFGFASIPFSKFEDSPTSQAIQDIALVILPVIMGFLFGSQKDIWTSWLFWLPRKQETSESFGLTVPNRPHKPSNAAENSLV